MSRIKQWIACETVLPVVLHRSSTSRARSCAGCRYNLRPGAGVAQEHVGEDDQLAHDGDEGDLEPQEDALAVRAVHGGPSGGVPTGRRRDVNAGSWSENRGLPCCFGFLDSFSQMCERLRCPAFLRGRNFRFPHSEHLSRMAARPGGGGECLLKTDGFRFAIVRLVPGGGRAVQREFGVVVCDACRPGFDRDFPAHMFVQLGRGTDEDIEKLCREGVLAGRHCVRCGARHGFPRGVASAAHRLFRRGQ